jgi:hypothetical protein
MAFGFGFALTLGLVPPCLYLFFVRMRAHSELFSVRFVTKLARTKLHHFNSINPLLGVMGFSLGRVHLPDLTSLSLWSTRTAP